MFARSFVLLLLLVTASGNDPSLYEILGVSRTATTKEIKKAYRKKALDTHPDKNKGIPPEEAAKDFHSVVHAFEILSDDDSRRRYDRTGRSDNSAGGRSDGGGGFRRGFGNFHFRSWQHQKLKDKFEVKEAQSRVMHIVSLSQLETVILDDDGLAERNLLLCFVVPGKVEEVANDEIVFPYPFAAMSSQGIWWEDLLQTGLVRYHRENDLSRFFGVPHGDDLRKSGKPVVVFVRRGEPLSKFASFASADQQEMESWVWKQLQIHVEFKNEHSHPVELYWIHTNKAKKRKTIPPGESCFSITMLSHQWIARDERIDRFEGSPNRRSLSPNSLLGDWKIVSDTQRVIVIEGKSCMDMSGHCQRWSNYPRPGECNRNPRFMHEKCPLTCGVCMEKSLDANQTNHDEL